MKENFKRAIAAVTVAAVCTGGLCACGKKENASVSGIPEGNVSYPIDTDETLTYWVKLAGAISTSVKNFGETPFAKKYMENTGIKVTYKHPAQGQEAEALNLLIASGDLPDIIESDWLARDPGSSISKKTILELNDIIKKQSPNLQKYLSEHPNIDKQVKTDDGKYYVYPFIRGDELLRSTAGFMLRADWLSELSMDVPETIDEWTEVLKAFKEKKKADTPFTATISDLSYFAGAYGIEPDFYVDNGKVKYGSLENGFKDYLETIKSWYDMGFLDKNFAVMEYSAKNAAMLDGTAGATFGAGGGALGVYLNAKKDSGESYDLVAAPFPTLKKGDKSEFGNKQLEYSSLNCAAITGKCKNPELAARFLDYSYSEEGYMLNNFGIEGESYEMKDGYPTYTKLITDNPDGLAMANALGLYVRSSGEAPMVQDKRYIEQYYQYDRQKEALKVWSDNNHENHKMPQVTRTKEENTEYNKIMKDLTVYRDEAMLEFIVGTRSMNDFDKYIEKLKSLKIERAIEIQQAAYDRFLKR